MQAQTLNDGAAEAITDQTTLSPKTPTLMESAFATEVSNEQY